VWVPRRDEIGAVWGRFLLNYIVVREKEILLMQNSLWRLKVGYCRIFSQARYVGVSCIKFVFFYSSHFCFLHRELLIEYAYYAA